jgi:hypothetical protein
MAHSIETLEQTERQRTATVTLVDQSAPGSEPVLGAMAPRAKPPTDPSMTLSKMRELGARELIVLCLNPACRHAITFSGDYYTDEIEVSWFMPRMICARCGGGRSAVRPNWKEQPSMSSLPPMRETPGVLSGS